MGDTPVPSRPVTYDDLLALPDNVVGEIVGGELFVSPRPALRHAAACSSIHSRVSPAYNDGEGGPGGWRILFEPELHLGGDVLVPDMAGWRRTRMPVLPDTPYASLAPDWVCEVLSPSTARLDRARKLAAYAREGVAYAWLVDPIARTLEVLQLEQSRWRIVSVYSDEDAPRVPPFEDITLHVSRLWVD